MSHLTERPIGLLMTIRRILLIFGLALLAGCTSTNASKDLPSGASAYSVVGTPGQMERPQYHIAAYDVVQITTYNEPGLSFAEVPIDADGGFSFPFIGRVTAAGLTPFQLEQEVKNRLDAQYTRNAQVTIFVKSANSQVFTVEGDVNKPGSFEYAGRTTLLDAVARAGSPTVTAKVNEIVVFRFVNNERYGAVFNLNDIREGRAGDPELFAGDTVVVGYSAIKSGWRDFLSIGPILNAFTRF